MNSNNANDLILLADEIKRRPLLTQYLTPAAKRGYVCIGCGNGSGDDGTGAMLNDDENRLLCGKCQKSFSNIDVIARHLGIGTSGSDFIEVVKFGCDFFGLPFDFDLPAQKKNPVHDELKNLIRSDVEKANAQLDELPEMEKRNLNADTLQTFKIGVDFNWIPPKNRLKNEKLYDSPRVIIPHLTNPALPNIPLTYCAALFISDRVRFERQEKSYQKYLYAGNRTPFGLNTLNADAEFVFVTEGEFDALSIWQATGGKYPCLATGGTALNQISDSLTKFFKKRKPQILFFADNDNAGIKFAKDFCNELIKCGFNATFATFATLEEQKLDANKILIFDGDNHLAEMIQAELDRIAKLEEQNLFGENSAVYFTEHFQAYVDENLTFAGRKTGFENLDDELKSFLPGVYILGGLPALGKTTFALQLLDQLAQNGNHCIYVSFEMLKGFLYSKLLAREVARIETKNFSKTISGKDIYRLTATQISLGKINDFHRDAYYAALQNFKTNPKPLYIWEETKLDIDKLLNRLERICAKLELPPVVCIDYLQLLAAGSDNVKSTLDEVLFKIFTFRRKTNSTFIIISSLNRANYQTEISFESFKESGSIEYSADAIWGLQLLLDKRTAENAEKAKKEIPRQIQLKCLKNRFGANFDIGFFYHPNADVFVPMLEYGDFTDTIQKNYSKKETDRYEGVRKNSF